MSACDVLVLAPFRPPVFRTAISPLYPMEEPWDSPPLLLAGGLVEGGFDVRYLALQNIYVGFDPERDQGELSRLIGEHAPRIAVFASDHFVASRSTATLYGIRVAAAMLKQTVPPPLVGVTGRLATALGASLFAEAPEVDFLTSGEVELVISDIVEALFQRGLAARHPHLLTQSEANEWRRDHPSETAVVAELDSLPLPAFHLLERSIQEWKRRRRNEDLVVPLSLRTSMGCRFQCRFCAGVPNWRQYRLKSAARVDRELERMEQHLFGRARLSFLEDEIFTADVEHVRSVCGVLQGRGVRLDGLYTHSSLLTTEIAAMLEPVTGRVLLGMDHADDDVLRNMRKGQRLDTVLRAVEAARAAGLKTHLEWIIGTPDESVDTLITSLCAIYSLLATGTVDSLNSYVYCPHPGTDYAVRQAAVGMQVLGSYAEMQESGGFPAAATRRLSRQQVFTAYLMSQVIIAEIREHRAAFGPQKEILPPNRTALRELFAALEGT